MVMAAECMANQYRVGAIGIQRAVGFVDDVIAGQLASARERNRLGEMLNLRYDESNGIGGKSCGHRDGFGCLCIRYRAVIRRPRKGREVYQIILMEVAGLFMRLSAGLSQAPWAAV